MTTYSRPARNALFSVLTCVAACTAPTAFAQNTGGVFSPIVNEGHKSLQYRGTFDTDSDGCAQRVHYQQAVNGDVMWRLLGQARKTAESDVDGDFLQAEVFWQLDSGRADWASGLRFDLRYRSEGRPGQVGVNWTNQFKLSDQRIARAVLLTAADVGDGARDGVFLQSRFLVQQTLDAHSAVGLELYNSYGSTDKLGDIEDNPHQLGPYFSRKLGQGYSAYAGALFGLTDATPDTNLRLWLTKGF